MFFEHDNLMDIVDVFFTTKALIIAVLYVVGSAFCVGRGFWLFINGHSTNQKQYWIGALGLLLLAIPIALQMRVVTSMLPLLGAAIIWWGARYHHAFFWRMGVIVQAFSSLSHMMVYISWEEIFTWLLMSSTKCYDASFFSENGASVVIIAISSGVSLWACYVYSRNHSEVVDDEEQVAQQRFNNHLRFMAKFYLLWEVMWWAGMITYATQRCLDIDFHYPHLTRLFLNCFVILALCLLPYRRLYQFAFYKQIIYKIFTIIMPLTLWIAGRKFVLICLLVITQGSASGDAWLINSLLFFGRFGVEEMIVWILFAMLGIYVHRQLKEDDSLIVDITLFTWMMAVLTMWTLAVIYNVHHPMTSNRYVLPGIQPHILDNGFTPQKKWYIATHYIIGNRYTHIWIVWIIFGALISFKPDWFSRFMPRERCQRWFKRVVYWVLICVLLLTAMLPSDQEIWLPIFNSLDSLMLVIAFILIQYEREKPSNYETLFIIAITGLSILWRLVQHYGYFF